MAPKLRKFLIWLGSLGAAVLAYFIITGINQTPEIDIYTPNESADFIADADIDPNRKSVAVVGDVGVEAVEKARFLDFNKQKQVEREFGFEKLLHEQGRLWEIEKPFMNIYKPNFKCLLTADNGKVRVETIVGRPSPKDATLTGNVVVHILPEGDSNISESFIYLDDLVYVSDRSQFSTTGPVEFVSKDARMLGRGLEMVYNGATERLEYLKIVDLHSLHLKQAPAPARASAHKQALADTPPTGLATSRQQPAKQAGTQDSQKPLPLRGQPAQNQPVPYIAVFNKNVVIDSPEQIILADRLCINNIFLSSSNQQEPETRSPPIHKSKTAGPETSQPSSPPAQSSVPVESAVPAEPDQSQTDIIVTCDNGIVVTPADLSESMRTALEAGFVPAGTEHSNTAREGNCEGRTKFIAEKIDYCAVTGNITAPGASELTFCTTDIAEDGTRTSVPVKITAQKQTLFESELDQAVFEGDCVCTMTRRDPNVLRRYMLTAPKLLATISSGAGGAVTDAGGAMEHLTATGGTVRLAMVRTAPQQEPGVGREKILGGVELRCARFDFDNRQQMFVAAGPGVLKVDNSNVSEPHRDSGKLGLRRRCYAFVRDFDTLKYFSQTNQIIADSASRQIILDYIPVGEDNSGEQIRATAGHIKANLTETVTGATGLSTLYADGGVMYREGNTEFVGGRLFYDHDRSLMLVNADQLQPCYFNGAAVDAIEYNLRTGKIKTEIVAPGPMQLKR